VTVPRAGERDGADGAVIDTIDLWPSTVGVKVSSFRITPYAPTADGVRALR
jgi:hypothetical protein